METFSALLAICAGSSQVTGEFTAQRPVTQSFDIFFDLRLNKRLSKQSCGWWFETLSYPLWRHCNEMPLKHAMIPLIQCIYKKSFSIFTSSTFNIEKANGLMDISLIFLYHHKITLKCFSCRKRIKGKTKEPTASFTHQTFRMWVGNFINSV